MQPRCFPWRAICAATSWSLAFLPRSITKRHIRGNEASMCVLHSLALPTYTCCRDINNLQPPTHPSAMGMVPISGAISSRKTACTSPSCGLPRPAQHPTRRPMPPATTPPAYQSPSGSTAADTTKVAPRIGVTTSPSSSTTP